MSFEQSQKFVILHNINRHMAIFYLEKEAVVSLEIGLLFFYIVED